MQLGEARRVALPRSHRRDFDAGVPQEDFDQLQRRVAGATQNCNFDHLLLFQNRRPLSYCSIRFIWGTIEFGISLAALATGSSCLLCPATRLLSRRG